MTDLLQIKTRRDENDRSSEAEAKADANPGANPDPNDLPPLAAAAWDAQIASLWSEAVEHSEDIRKRFPGHPSGWAVGSHSLRQIGRLDEAETVVVEAMERFPGEAWPIEEAAYSAQTRNDWDHAVERAERARLTSPDRTAGYSVGIMALSRKERYREAETVAVEAIRRFPEEDWAYEGAAWAARDQRDWDNAALLSAQARDRFPDRTAGYLVGIQASRHGNDFDRAEELAEQAKQRFPDAAWPLEEARQSAVARQDATDRQQTIDEAALQATPAQPGHTETKPARGWSIWRSRTR